MKPHLLFAALGTLLLVPHATPGIGGPTWLHSDGHSAPDSTLLPDGFWTASQWIRLGDYEISGFILQTVDYQASGKPRPRSVVRAWIEVGRVDVQNTPRVRCPRPLIRVDTLALRCPGTAIGEVRLEGRFVVAEAGSPDSTHRVAGPPGPLNITALVQVVRGGRLVYTATHEFTQTDGD